MTYSRCGNLSGMRGASVRGGKPGLGGSKPGRARRVRADEEGESEQCDGERRR